MINISGSYVTVKAVTTIYIFRIGTAVLRAPNGIRTRVTAVKGRCPRPLDDGDVLRLGNLTRDFSTLQTKKSDISLSEKVVIARSLQILLEVLCDHE